MADTHHQQDYRSTGWYIAVVLAVALSSELMANAQAINALRFLTLAMYLVSVRLAIRNVFARRGTTVAFALLLGAINFIGLGGDLVFQVMRRIGQPISGYTSITFFLIAIGLWCQILVNKNRWQSGTDRQEEVDFWHPDQEAT